MILDTLSDAKGEAGSPPEAKELLTDAARLAIPASYLNLGVIALGQGDYPAARDLLCDALELFREERDEAYEAVVLENLAQTAARQRDTNAAREYATQALRIRRGQQDADGIAYDEKLLSGLMSLS